MSQTVIAIAVLFGIVLNRIIGGNSPIIQMYIYIYIYIYIALLDLSTLYVIRVIVPEEIKCMYIY